MSSGKFLGHMVNRRGVEANPEQIQALLNLRAPTNVKELQKLIVMKASLNRFISKCSDRCQPFFKALKKSKTFLCDEDCDKALEDLKAYLSSPPLISIPQPNEQLYLYLSSSSKAINAALVSKENGVQKSVYYASKSLIPIEKNYIPIEKLALALVHAQGATVVRLSKPKISSANSADTIFFALGARTYKAW